MIFGNYNMSLCENCVKMTMLLIVTLSCFIAISQGLRCSVCNSETQADCETTPPPSQECWDPGSGVPKTCIIIKRFDANDKVIAFRRDCSTVQTDKCVDLPEFGGKTCSDVCFTDSCNSSTVNIHSFTLLTLICLLSTMLLHL